MSVRNNNNQLLNPQAMQAMDKFKQEAAQELNISDEYKSGYWGNLTSRECGSVGGQMVKQMINEYENKLATNADYTTQNQQDQSQQAQIQNETENYDLASKTGSFQPQG